MRHGFSEPPLPEVFFSDNATAGPMRRTQNDLGGKRGYRVTVDHFRFDILLREYCSSFQRFVNHDPARTDRHPVAFPEQSGASHVKIRVGPFVDRRDGHSSQPDIDGTFPGVRVADLNDRGCVIRGTEDGDVRQKAHQRKILEHLVRRPVLSDGDASVRSDQTDRK